MTAPRSSCACCGAPGRSGSGFVRCSQCGAWTVGRPHVDERRYDDGYFEREYLGELRCCRQRRAEAFLDLVAPTGTLLDIGAGAGLLLAMARGRGLDVIGVEPSPAGRRLARREFDLDLFSSLDEVKAAGLRVDVVVLHDVIAHVQRPLDLLAEIRGVLSVRGRVALKTLHTTRLAPVLSNAFHWVSGRDPLLGRSVRYHAFDEKSMAKLVEAAGFVVNASLTRPEIPCEGNASRRAAVVGSVVRRVAGDDVVVTMGALTDGATRS